MLLLLILCYVPKQCHANQRNINIEYFTMEVHKYKSLTTVTALSLEEAQKQKCITITQDQC